VRTQPELPAEILLDWNESPIGAPLAAVERIVATAHHLHRYPRGLMEEVTDLAAAHLGVAPEQILLTAGVDEAIDITLGLADRAWGTLPGFDAIAERAEVLGKPFRAIPLDADWQPGDRAPGAGDADIVYLAQPNNPTGNLFDESWIDRVRAAARYVFIDETYLEFSSRPSVLSSGDDPRLLVYRSFSKAFGLAGIRVGCLVATPETVARMAAARRFMPIDAVSLNAAAGVLGDTGFIKRLTEHVLLGRADLTAILGRSGLFADVRDTEANFVLAHPRADVAARLAAGLARRRLRVKECTPLGLPGWLRVSVGSRPEHQALDECLTGIATGGAR